ncbi:protein-methionine-sulfoxide reductase catalytic subunit MsrP [Lichenihabitans sp. Uapishka_5]|uniref:protein-methionine-sulfoxide reductase catalytic subunit MsrP n=1 Tax=Lichenihabitans sp. Uapishka_5 TaxID=3037302 RepID=UPI0029E8079C|nr:protein-methionine-sulfoxide reductase catalytic subunit MsrP [Lichenihabitans sp. Uapishka_5]MDX7952974.1 protein-methionine-sulfoxide reductase catalytic subunit MsrP [Lichenihabitans sp. Uapishka_5]
MLIRRLKGWELPEREATPEALMFNRRAVLAGGLAAGAIASPLLSRSAWADTAGLYPAKRNAAFTIASGPTPEADNTNYNNFYEYGTSKHVAAAAEALKPDPWTVSFDGLVDTPRKVAFEDLVKALGLEERLYRHRCVEGWAMTVPWTGFPLKALVDYAKPQSGAKYVQFETFMDPKMAPGQKSFFYPWPYLEGVSMAEATNDLAFMVTGAYGKPLPKVMGAPLRLALPWKYGFKSIKSISRISFVAERPKTFWAQLNADEYGFWANVNPAVPHPRWSQSSEAVLGTNDRQPTQLFNGYAAQVASLYDGLKGESLYM